MRDRRANSTRLAIAALTSLLALFGGLAAWTSDASAQQLALTITSPADGSRIGTQTPTFTGTTTDELEPLLEEYDELTLTIHRGTTGEGPVVQGPLGTSEAPTWSIGPVQQLPPGTYTAVAEQTTLRGDAPLEPETARTQVTFTIDTTPPQVTLEAPADGSSTASGTIGVSGTAGTEKGDLPVVTVELYQGASTAGQAPLESSSVAATEGRWSTMLGGLAPGRYTLDAVQLDSAGNQGASASHTITVLAPPSPQPPAASFTWFPSSPHAGETVTLVSTSSSPRSPVTNLAWDLAGNGRFSQSGPVVTTTFTTPGRHLVQLRATDAEGASGVTSQVIVVAAPQLVLMQPFPIVRIAGRETAAGVSLSLVQVTAPVNATVTISCHGRGCPTRRQTRVARAGRHGSSSGSVTVVFRRFAHSLRAGTVLVFRVTAPGEIGKYTRFSIRRHRLPLRFDGCVGPIDPNPIRCPS